MEYHKLLTRQLKRLNLDEAPPTPKDWGVLKELISKTYAEADQERYLLERSMEISSEEMLEINDKLQTAQATAGLGYWTYDKSDDILTFSHNLYSIFGLNPADAAPTYEKFLDLVHEANRTHLKKITQNAFLHGERYEYEFRMKYNNDDYRWYSIIGHPVAGQNPITTLTGIVLDITKRKIAENEISILNKKLIESARYAGMADIASSTLHNVGNVLNSASVSIELLKEPAFLSNQKEVDDALALLHKNLSRFPEYIQTDPQGKFVPEYLVALLESIKANYELFGKELNNIDKHLSHIKDIISTQNDISRASGLSEMIFLPELMDAALEMTSTSFDKYSINIEKDYQTADYVLLDKVKVIQILVNLIKNAKDAVLEDSENIDKIITCTLAEHPLEKKIIMKVKDNGIGITSHDLSKIFSLGFTTKPHGHGFGLHMSAITAKEMGGSLVVESKGPGQGATFTLILPKIEVQEHP